MEFPVTLLDLAGSIALLLWGVRMVQTGVRRAPAFDPRHGPALACQSVPEWPRRHRRVAEQHRNRTDGLGLRCRRVDLVPALAVMLGANVGTTLIVQLLSLDLSPVTPMLILLGVLMFRRSQSSTSIP
jgi:phosphate:Na+ symporter